MAYVIVKAANSPRPANWILERSLDGENYMPWQYYAISDSECWNRYGIKPTLGVPRFTKDNQVMCSSYYSRLDPLTEGEVRLLYNLNDNNYLSNSTTFREIEFNSDFSQNTCSQLLLD